MGDRNLDFVEYRSFLFTKDIMSFLKCSIFDQYPKASIYVASDSNFAKGIILNNTMNHEVFSFTPKATHSDSAFKSTKGNDIVSRMNIAPKVRIVVADFFTQLFFRSARQLSRS